MVNPGLERGKCNSRIPRAVVQPCQPYKKSVSCNDLLDRVERESQNGKTAAQRPPATDLVRKGS